MANARYVTRMFVMVVGGYNSNCDYGEVRLYSTITSVLLILEHMYVLMIILAF